MAVPKLVVFWTTMVLTFASLASPASAAYLYLTLSPPGAPVGDQSAAYAINDLGQVLVQAYDPRSYNFTDVNDVYSISSGAYSSLPAFPGSTPASTAARGISNNGVIVGFYSPPGGEFQAYVDVGGSYSTVNLGGAAFALAFGVNDKGEIVGLYGATSINGFVVKNGVFGAVSVADPALYSTGVLGVNNNGDFVGDYGLNSGSDFNHGFFATGTVLTRLDLPGYSSTHVGGLNNADVVVGSASNDNYRTGPGFIYNNGVYSLFTVPGAIDTIPYGINDAGVIVGSYSAGATLPSRAFVAIPIFSLTVTEPPAFVPGAGGGVAPEPSGWLLMTAGLGGLGGALRRRSAMGRRNLRCARDCKSSGSASQFC